MKCKILLHPSIDKSLSILKRSEQERMVFLCLRCKGKTEFFIKQTDYIYTKIDNTYKGRRLSR